MSLGNHRFVITIGLTSIALVLMSFYLRADRSEPAHVQEAVTTASITDAVVAQMVASPTVTSKKSMVTTEVTVMVTPVSPRLSPSLSPSSPAVSPRLSSTSTPSPTLTPQSQITVSNVVINEIGWMGTDASPADEWIELYNPGIKSVDLSGWVLLSTTDGSPNIKLKGQIAGSGYFLIERTDNTTISDILADMVTSFGTGGLRNEGEVLVLKNQNGDTVDTAGGSGKWLAGTNTPKASMERISPVTTGTDPANWATHLGSGSRGLDHGGNPIQGTPKAKNSASQ